MSYKRESYNRRESPVRPDYKLAYKIGVTFDTVFFIIVIAIIVKLFLLLGY